MARDVLPDPGRAHVTPDIVVIVKTRRLERNRMKRYLHEGCMADCTSATPTGHNQARCHGQFLGYTAGPDSLDHPAGAVWSNDLQAWVIEEKK